MIAVGLWAALLVQEVQDLRTWTVEFGDWHCACDCCAANLARTLRAIPEVAQAQVAVADAARGLGTATIAQRERGSIRLDLVTNALRPQTVRAVQVALRAWGERAGDTILLRARTSGETIRVARPREPAAQRAFDGFLASLGPAPAKIEATLRFAPPEWGAQIVRLARSEWPDPVRR